MEFLSLHGFLGLAEDWEFLSADGCEFRGVDLWRYADRPELAQAARIFNDEIRKRGGTKPTLLGYSLGGRFAMHAVTMAPELYRAAVFVSAHPGLSDIERTPRFAGDRAWAGRFRREPWPKLMQDWNSQAVFQPPSANPKRIRLERSEAHFSRNRLAAVVESWSVARQSVLLPALRELQIPILFISGEADRKYTELLEKSALGSRIEMAKIAGAGHRVPWDEPEAFRHVIAEFAERHGLSSS